MTNDESIATPASGVEPASPTTSPQVFGDWLEEVRMQCSPANEQAPPAPHLSVGPRSHVWGLTALMAACATGGFFAAGAFYSQPTIEVHGRLVDPSRRPLTGARVFLASDPRVEGLTDRHGIFRLTKVPVGDQSLVVVAEDVGEEYTLHGSGAELEELGQLVYHVPPRYVRMSPGSGAGW